jgi:hypothetical protein
MTNAAPRSDRGFAALWGWPLGLAALSVFGLLSALLGQGGIWWILSWIALATPLAVILRHGVARSWRKTGSL